MELYVDRYSDHASDPGSDHDTVTFSNQTSLQNFSLENYNKKEGMSY